MRDAFLAVDSCLERAAGESGRQRDAVLLVTGTDGRVVGRLAPEDILRGLETEVVSHTDPLSMADGLILWDRPLAHLAVKARYLKIRKVHRPLYERDFIEEDATRDQALRQLRTIACHRSSS